MTKTSIQWATDVWNPVRGCSLVSAGCRSCYAMKQAHRFSGPGQAYEGLTKMTPAGPQWTGKVRLVPEALNAPLHWRKPRRVFVNSMSDLFHDAVPDEFIDEVFRTMMRAAPSVVQLSGDSRGFVQLPSKHVFQILTKRPERMRDYILGDAHKRIGASLCWPLPCVWLGVSCENQEAADERIPVLLQTPAAVRFLSCEPLLGPIDLGYTFAPAYVAVGGRPCVDWVIVGGESGPGSRPCEARWIRDLVEECKAAGVACFVKQLGAKPVARDRWDMGEQAFVDADAAGWTEADGATVMRLRDRKGGDPEEWPEELRVREFPGGGG